MECSTRRMEQVAKLLADELTERLAGKHDVNEVKRMMRELVKEATNVGMGHALEHGKKLVEAEKLIYTCGEKAQFISNALR